MKIGRCEASCTEKCSYSLLEFFLIPFIINFMSKLAKLAQCPCLLFLASHSSKQEAASEVGAYFFTSGFSQGPEGLQMDSRQCFIRSLPPDPRVVAVADL